MSRSWTENGVNNQEVTFSSLENIAKRKNKKYEGNKKGDVLRTQLIFSSTP